MRFWLILCFILGLVLLLKSQFPYAVSNPQQMQRLFYLLLLLILVAGSGVFKRMRMTQAVRDGAIWIGLILALVLGYSFRDQIKGSRLYSELVPSRVQVSADGALTVESSADGHFHVEAEVNGVLLNFLIDTGASDIVLAPNAAEAAGFDIATLNYSRQYSTAGGIVRGAPVKIDNLTVGSVTLRGVPASVNGVEMDESLLGMTFLRQFKGYNVDGNTLTIYPE